MNDARIISIDRALNDTFIEIKIESEIDDVSPESGFAVMLQSARKVITAAMRARNCFKFGLTVECVFQV